MNFIKEILIKKSISMEELLNCFEQVKNKGDIALIKFDGQRNEDEYTVLIAFPEIKKREMIRADESSLRIALIKVLTEYVEGDR